MPEARLLRVRSEYCSSDISRVTPVFCPLLPLRNVERFSPLTVQANGRTLVAEQNAQARTGSCICRGVTFRVIGDPLRVGICHCTDCRKVTGSTFSVFAVWPREAFEMTGFIGTYADRSFCPTCGGRVASIRVDEVEVMIGTLDQVPTDLTPEYELWTGRRENWLNPLQSATQFEKDAEPLEMMPR